MVMRAVVRVHHRPPWIGTHPIGPDDMAGGQYLLAVMHLCALQSRTDLPMNAPAVFERASRVAVNPKRDAWAGQPEAVTAIEVGNDASRKSSGTNRSVVPSQCQVVPPPWRRWCCRRCRGRPAGSNHRAGRFSGAEQTGRRGRATQAP